jgi:hypothetical protein
MQQNESLDERVTRMGDHIGENFVAELKQMHPMLRATAYGGLEEYEVRTHL